MAGTVGRGTDAPNVVVAGRTMRIKATFRIPRVDFGKYLAALKERLGDAIAHAAFEWLGATTSVIPVWSGASLATFLPLASQVGLSILVSPVASSRIDLGLSNATGEVKADADKGRFEFSYSTSLAHLIYNEANNANISPDPTLFSKLKQPGPYHFQEKGKAAVKRVFDDVRLPSPVFKTTTLKV